MEETGGIGARLAVESLKYFVATLTCTAVLAVGHIAIARLLGPERYGQYIIALIVPTTLASVMTLGIPSGLIKHVSEAMVKNRGAVAGYFKAALVVATAVGIALTAIQYVFADLFSLLVNRPGLAGLIRIASLLVLANLLMLVINSFLVGVGMAGASGLLRLLYASVRAPSMVALILLGFGVLGAITGHILGVIVAVAVGFAYSLLRVCRRLGAGSGPSVVEAASRMMGYGFPLYLSALLLNFSRQYVNISLTWFVSDAEIGGYTATVNVMTAASLFLTPIVLALFPGFSMISARDVSRLPAAFGRAVRIATSVVLPVAVYLAAYGPEVMRIFYGSRYVFAGGYVTLYALVYIFQPMVEVMRGYFNGVGLPRETLKMFAVYFAVVATLAPPMVALFRVPGGIAALVAATAAAMAYGAARCVGRGLSMEARHTAKLLAILAAAAAASAPAHVLYDGSLFGALASAGLGGVAYLLAALTLMGALGVPGDEDLSFIDGSLGDKPLIGPLLRLAIRYVRAIRALHQRGRRSSRAPTAIASRRENRRTCGSVNAICGNPIQ